MDFEYRPPILESLPRYHYLPRIRALLFHRQESQGLVGGYNPDAQNTRERTLRMKAPDTQVGTCNICLPFLERLSVLPALLQSCCRGTPGWLWHGDVHHHLPEPGLLHRLAHRPADKNRFQSRQHLCSQESKLQFIANRITLRKSALVAWVGNPSFTASQPLSESVTLR